MQSAFFYVRIFILYFCLKTCLEICSEVILFLEILRLLVVFFIHTNKGLIFLQSLNLKKYGLIAVPLMVWRYNWWYTSKKAKYTIIPFVQHKNMLVIYHRCVCLNIWYGIIIFLILFYTFILLKFVFKSVSICVNYCCLVNFVVHLLSSRVLITSYFLCILLGITISV